MCQNSTATPSLLTPHRPFTSAGLSCASCVCLSLDDYAHEPHPDDHNLEVSAGSTSCPYGPFPAGSTAADFRVNEPIWNVSCFPDVNMDIFTLITNVSTFDPGEAVLCNLCPGGYGPDEDCVRQPNPLPTPCCWPGQPCANATGDAQFPGNGTWGWEANPLGFPILKPLP